MNKANKEFIVGLAGLFVANKINVDQFCSKIEDYINFELDFKKVTAREKKILEDLFEAVAWYNPFENERNEYSGFKSEEEIKTVAEKVLLEFC